MIHINKTTSFVLKGNIIYSRSKDEIHIIENGYLICEEGKSKGVYDVLPLQYKDYEIIDYGDKLILPGLIDIHTHAPQYSFRGLGMDLELIEWLNVNTFPEEGKYSDLEYAKKAYSIFVEELKKSATTRACIFGTIHIDATILLMDLLEQSGLKSMVGKVNMDQNSPAYLCENCEESIRDTKIWLNRTKNKYKNVEPIVTPRFLPSCSDLLLQKLSEVQLEYNVPVQSHLSENMEEVRWVQELFPTSKSYGDAYNQFGLFGGNAKTVMAHCVYCSDDETDLMLKNGVYVAHCPDANTNLSSGIAPIRTYLDKGLNIGLGTDIAAGCTLSIFRIIAKAIQVSKLRWRLVDDTLRPLTIEEAFYLATKGGGAFFGRVGSFEEGFEFDAIVIDDSSLKHPQPLSLRERFERVIYLWEDRLLYDKFVAGIKIDDLD